MPDLAAAFTAENLIALLTLTSLEVVLGIDNIVFISILTGRLPEHQRAKARNLGLGIAMGARIVLLLAITWVMSLEKYVLFTVFGHEVNGKALILLVGGLFLIGKATYEIHHKLEGPDRGAKAKAASATFGATIAQIGLIDVVFSLDSVITAVGMARAIWVMITAVVVAIVVMMIFAGPVSRFIERHPTMKMLALSFLLLIGVMLVIEGVGQHVSKGYIYFAMGFSLFVELLNLRVLKVHKSQAAHPEPPAGGTV